MNTLTPIKCIFRTLFKVDQHFLWKCIQRFLWLFQISKHQGSPLAEGHSVPHAIQTSKVFKNCSTQHFKGLGSIFTKEGRLLEVVIRLKTHRDIIKQRTIWTGVASTHNRCRLSQLYTNDRWLRSWSRILNIQKAF